MVTDGVVSGAGRSWWPVVVTWLLVWLLPAIDPERLPLPAEGTVTPAGTFVPARPPVEPAAIPAAELITATAPGRFLIAGRIVLDRTAGTVSIPAVVNMRHGQVEYLLVSEQGKCHEAVFRTPVQPGHVHLACLLAGAPSESLPLAVAARLPPTTVTMVWHRHGPPARVPVEDLVRPAPEAPPGPAAPAPVRWIYNGSSFSAAGFAAQMEGSCIALIADPSALINGDGLAMGPYHPVAERLPAEGTPVSLILQLPRPATAQEP